MPRGDRKNAQLMIFRIKGGIQFWRNSRVTAKALSAEIDRMIRRRFASRMTRCGRFLALHRRHSAEPPQVFASIQAMRSRRR
jgi:hypothetical protein